MGRIREFTVYPGVVKDDTALGAKPRWVDSNRIRFVKGYAQKLGGWEKRTAMAFAGVCRAMLAWLDATKTARIALGTHTKLIAVESAIYTNITPYRREVTLGLDPFTTTSGSPLVNVADTNNGAGVGDTVNFSGATAVNGITLDGDYIIVSLVDSDNYVVDAGTDATGTSSGGGASVDAKYEISIGRIDGQFGAGWGVGPYGQGTYGTPRSSVFLLNARTWTLDQWGQYLVACPRDGNIYEWQLNPSVRAQLLPNAPTGVAGIWVTDEKHLVAYGLSNDAMRLEWSDQDDNTVWAPSDLNTAGGRTLVGGSQIVLGMRTGRGNFILTDGSAWEMLFVGGLNPFGFEQVGSGAVGAIGPQAARDVQGVAYWMGFNDFYRYDGVISTIPRSKEIRRFVFDNLVAAQRDKVHCWVNTLFSELWWFYTDTLENNRYVKVNWETWDWDVGVLDRTAAVDRGVFENPIAVDASSFLYNHESGNDADGVAMNEFIISSPRDIDQQARFVDILAYIPDFKDLTGSIKAELIVRGYPQRSGETINMGLVTPTTDFLDDFRASGRQAQLRVGCTQTLGTFWRMGVQHMEIEDAGER